MEYLLVSIGRIPITLGQSLINAILGVAFPDVSGKLYPMVGMESLGARIRVNFGLEPFRYRDIESG